MESLRYGIGFAVQLHPPRLESVSIHVHRRPSARMLVSDHQIHLRGDLHTPRHQPLNGVSVRAHKLGKNRRRATLTRCVIAAQSQSHRHAANLAVEVQRLQNALQVIAPRAANAGVEPVEKLISNIIPGYTVLHPNKLELVQLQSTNLWRNKHLKLIEITVYPVLDICFRYEFWQTQGHQYRARLPHISDLVRLVPRRYDSHTAVRVYRHVKELQAERPVYSRSEQLGRFVRRPAGGLNVKNATQPVVVNCRSTY